MRLRAIDVRMRVKREPAVLGAGPVHLADTEYRIDDGIIERLIELLDARTGARLQLPGLEAGVSYDLLYFDSGAREEIEPFELPLVVPGTTKTPLGSFVSEYVPIPESFGKDRNVAYVDARSLSGAVLRLRRDGDRIYPIGAPGRKKLKDYFIDRKVPRGERVLPLL